MKKQIVFIHGGETFASYEDYFEYLKGAEYDPYEERSPIWKDTLAEDLGDDYELLMPSMPSKYNAKYSEWKLWFEKVIPFMRDELVLVGWSLGGIFLAKFLSENELPVSVKSLHLIAAPHDDSEGDYSLADFVLPESLEALSETAREVHLYHSEDDYVVPFGDIKKYAKQLPEAHLHTFSDRNHFLVETFPELLKNLQN